MLFHVYNVETEIHNLPHSSSTVISFSKYEIKAISLKRKLYGLYGVRISGSSVGVVLHDEHSKRSG